MLHMHSDLSRVNGQYWLISPCALQTNIDAHWEQSLTCKRAEIAAFPVGCKISRERPSTKHMAARPVLPQALHA
jgi:hypothetical protein